MIRYAPRRHPVPRRTPVAPKSLLLAVARQQLTLAQNAVAGRSVQPVCCGATGPLRHLVIALRAGEALGSELTASCVAWTVQVLQGRVCLTTGRSRRYAWPGELLAGPVADYHLSADHDAVVLATLVEALAQSPSGFPDAVV
jgi:hypothetical protein